MVKDVLTGGWKETITVAKVEGGLRACKRRKQHDARHTFKLSYLPLQDRFSSFGNTSSHFS